MKNKIAFLASVAILATNPAFASDQELNEINETVFASVDANSNDLVSMREVEHFHQLVMLSMDHNDDGAISEEEFLSWDLGWLFLAEGRGLSDAYRASRVEIFNTWDENRDGLLSEKEQEVEQAKRIFKVGDEGYEDMNFDAFVKEMPLVAALNRVFLDQ